MDSLKVETPKKRIAGKRSIGAADATKIFLVFFELNFNVIPNLGPRTKTSMGTFFVGTRSSFRQILFNVEH